ncbi:MAG: hypothetical protein RIS35_2496 [Pseudomonadota bacterium]|jgi:YggT family protein
MSRFVWFLVETLGTLIACASLLRALAWRARVSPRDPVHRFVIAATDWIVKPLRRFLPPAGTLDLASLAAAALSGLVTALAWALLLHGSEGELALVVPMALFLVLKWGLHLVMGLVLLQAILSWVNPQAPVAPTLDRLTQPFLAPLRNIVPLIGGVDLSPLVLLVLAQIAIALLETLFLSIG